MKTRVPDQLSDENSMRPFLDALDRFRARVAQINQLSATPSDAEIQAAVNAIIVAAQTR